MRGTTFPTRDEAAQYAASVEEDGWDAAYASLAGAPSVSSRFGTMTLKQLEQAIITADPHGWHRVDPRENRAILETNIAIALEWTSDPNAIRNPDDDAYACYNGLTRHLDSVHVLYNGSPVIKEALLTVEFKTRTKRGGTLFVPLAHENRRRWFTDPVAYALAHTVNILLWRQGYETYMDTSGVQALDD
ncbi:hypothetical protein GCM10009543_22130 [Leifsonia naganoensis]